MTSSLLISDIHSNNVMSVCPPTVNRENGGTYHHSPVQRWLYEKWQAVAEQFAEEAKHDDTLLFINGEAVEYDAKHRGSFEQVTQTEPEALRLGSDLVDMLAKSADHVYVMRGTFAHTGEAAKLDEMIGEDFGAVQSPENNYSWYHLNLTIDGVRLELAHHGSMGSRPWTQRNAANYLAADVLMTYAERGEQPPDLTVRGHLHRWSDSYDNYRVRGIFLPCFTFFSPYIHRRGKGHGDPEIGAMMLRTSGGKYEVEKLKFPVEHRVWQTVPVKEKEGWLKSLTKTSSRN